jgi:hypothetical protein
MGIESIPVVVNPAEDSGLTGNAAAVLREIAASLDSLARGGEGGVVDLGAMPLSPSDKAWLREQLGEGEVTITLDLDGQIGRASCRERVS